MADWDIIVVDPRRPRPAGVDGAPVFSQLPLIAVPHGVPKPDVGTPLAVRASYDPMYVRLLQGIDFCLNQKVDVLNLSLGPSQLLLSTPDDPDPLWVATDVARQRGVPVVVAAGNHGPAPDTLQFLARAPWSIAVGATDEQGRLLDLSSRGVPDGRTPTVVSLGTIDRPDPRFPKPSTSFAAPKVAAIAAWTKILLMLIGHDVQALLAGHMSASDLPLPVVGFCDTGIDRNALDNRDVAPTRGFLQTTRQAGWYRTVLDRLEQWNVGVQIRNDPATVSLALQLMAAPLPAYQPFEVGAGFVSRDQLFSFIADVVPSRFAILFGEPRDLARVNVADLDAFDRLLGPLWDAEQSAVLQRHVGRGYLRVMARVI